MPSTLMLTVGPGMLVLVLILRFCYCCQEKVENVGPIQIQIVETKNNAHLQENFVSWEELSHALTTCRCTAQGESPDKAP
jgi:hypothetical protein